MNSIAEEQNRTLHCKRKAVEQYFVSLLLTPDNFYDRGKKGKEVICAPNI